MLTTSYLACIHMASKRQMAPAQFVTYTIQSVTGPASGEGECASHQPDTLQQAGQFRDEGGLAPGMETREAAPGGL
jgi:hypothetical protein